MPKSTGNQQSDNMLVEVLQEQLSAALEREKKLIDMLEQEQRARREIEQKTLALPKGGAAKNRGCSLGCSVAKVDCCDLGVVGQGVVTFLKENAYPFWRDRMSPADFRRRVGRRGI
jgi:hypothetical protein